MAANTKALKWNQPEDADIPVWRYMDLSKFISMMAKESLHFSRPDVFHDPFEGMLSKNHTFPGNVQIGSSGVDVSIEEAAEFFRRWKFVNCWHANEHESAAMWKLYAKSNEAVAIKTTYKNLVECLPSSVEVGMVKYLDPDGGWAPPFGASSFTLAVKRPSFEYEREVRLIIDHGTPFHENGAPDFDKINPYAGLDLKVNVHHLIDAVYVAPDTDPWFLDTVESVKDKYGYSASFDVCKSKLSEVP